MTWICMRILISTQIKPKSCWSCQKVAVFTRVYPALYNCSLRTPRSLDLNAIDTIACQPNCEQNLCHGLAPGWLLMYWPMMWQSIDAAGSYVCCMIVPQRWQISEVQIANSSTSPLTMTSRLCASSLAPVHGCRGIMTMPPVQFVVF
jgi:hypothetical protein